MKKTKNKYLYLFIVQGNYGYGWDDLEDCETYREARIAWKDYAINESNYPHRIIKRRVLNV